LWLFDRVVLAIENLSVLTNYRRICMLLVFDSKSGE
jgi:hypothetical protein